MLFRSLLILLTNFIVVPALLNPAIAQDGMPDFGRFEPPQPDVRLGEEREVMLLVDFSYIDLRGESWRAPKGIIVDGASIPQIFWSYIGGPFEGRYRNASIIHDYYCEKRTRPSDEVHAVFYEAMLRSGVHPAKAWVMYKAVDTFGPKWRMAPPEACIDEDGQLNIAECAQASATIPALVPGEQPTEENLSEFVSEIAETGYTEEAELLAASLGVEQ